MSPFKLKWKLTVDALFKWENNQPQKYVFLYWLFLSRNYRHVCFCLQGICISPIFWLKHLEFWENTPPSQGPCALSGTELILLKLQRQKYNPGLAHQLIPSSGMRNGRETWIGAQHTKYITGVLSYIITSVWSERRKESRMLCSVVVIREKKTKVVDHT